MPAIYLDDLRWSDWLALYRLATHPSFFYRALNDRHAWVGWRVTRYLLKAKTAGHFKFLRRAAKAIRLADTRELIGCVVLVDIDKPVMGQGESGIFVAVPYHGKGIGKTALRLFFSWCLEKFSLQSIQATAHPDNKASIEIHKDAGLKEVGYIAADKSGYLDNQGKPEPRVVLRASRSEIENAVII